MAFKCPVVCTSYDVSPNIHHMTLKSMFFQKNITTTTMMILLEKRFLKQLQDSSKIF